MTKPSGGNSEPAAPRPSEDPPRSSTRFGDETPSIASDDLLQGKKAVVITHAGETYRLIVTRNDKLLLQK